MNWNCLPLLIHFVGIFHEMECDWWIGAQRNRFAKIVIVQALTIIINHISFEFWWLIPRKLYFHLKFGHGQNIYNGISDIISIFRKISSQYFLWSDKRSENGKFCSWLFLIRLMDQNLIIEVICYQLIPTEKSQNCAWVSRLKLVSCCSTPIFWTTLVIWAGQKWYCQ